MSDDTAPQNPSKPSDDANAVAAQIVNATQINAAKMAGTVGLGSGNNTFLPATAAERAHNFRASLDRERAAKREAANPNLAKTADAIVAGMSNDVAQFGRDEHRIEPPRANLPADRQGEFEDRIAALEAKLAEALWTIREMNGPLQRIFPAIPNPSSTNAAQWQEATVQGTNIVTFQDGRNCLSGTSAGQILVPGSNGAFALLEVADGTNRAYFKLGGDDTVVVNVNSAGSGKGKYNINVNAPTASDVDLTTDIDSSIFGAGGSGIGLNLLEISQDLPLSSTGYYLAKPWKVNSDGTRVYVIVGFDVEDCPSS